MPPWPCVHFGALTAPQPTRAFLWLASTSVSDPTRRPALRCTLLSRGLASRLLGQVKLRETSAASAEASARAESATRRAVAAERRAREEAARAEEAEEASAREGEEAETLRAEAAAERRSSHARAQQHEHVDARCQSLEAQACRAWVGAPAFASICSTLWPRGLQMQHSVATGQPAASGV